MATRINEMKVHALIVSKPDCKWTRPNNFLLFKNKMGQVCLGARIWDHVGPETLKRAIKIEAEVKRILSTKGLVKTISGTRYDADSKDKGDYTQKMIQLPNVSLLRDRISKDGWAIESMFESAIKEAQTKTGMTGIGFNLQNSVDTVALVKWNMINFLTEMFDNTAIKPKIILMGKQ